MRITGVGTAWKRVFARPLYLGFAMFVGVGAFLLATWAANAMLLWQLVFSADTPFADKLNLLIAFTGSIATNFTLFSASYTILISALFGLNAALLLFYIRQRKGSFGAGASTASGVGGVVSGVLGLGCSACGTALIGPLLALLGASALTAALPLGGGEFGILSVGLLSASIFLISRHINDPLVCPPNFSEKT